MLHFEHATTKEKHTMLLQQYNEAKRQIKRATTEFCTVSQQRYMNGILARAEANLKQFQESHPEVLI